MNKNDVEGGRFSINHKAGRSALGDFIHTGRSWRVIVKNRRGESLIQVSLLWAFIIAVAIPVSVIVVIIGVMAGVVTVVVERTGADPEPQPD